MKGLHAFSMQGTKLSSECPVPPLCPLVTFYRRPDGSCNNQRDSSLGTSFTPLKRLLLPDYEDGTQLYMCLNLYHIIFVVIASSVKTGLWKPRVSQSGSPLPSARLLSATITRDESHPHTFLTLWVMQFGQFIDHDLTHVPVFRLSTGQGIECCTNGGREFQPEERTHPLCLPISIPQDDNFHRAFRNRCMNFVRSMIASRSDCSLGYADQMNQVTHW
jgi:peroxidase